MIKIMIADIKVVLNKTQCVRTIISKEEEIHYNVCMHVHNMKRQKTFESNSSSEYKVCP